MFVAAAGVVEVGLSGCIVKEYVCVDDRIAGIEYRAVGQIFERPGGFIGYGYADTEVLLLLSGVFLPVGAEP